MIRTATENDVQALVALGADMVRESPVWSQQTYLPERTAMMVRQLVDGSMPHAFARVSERDGEIAGFLLAFAMPNWCCDYLEACDLALYVRPEYRGTTIGMGLVRAYIAWCKQIGAVCNLGITTGVTTDRTEQLIRVLGGTKTGNLWRF